MELRHLRYFVAVAEELHFGRAAGRLHLAQPPLSQAIKQLEAEVGATLLERSSRHVALTDAGRVLLGHARTTLAHAEGTLAAVQRAAAGLEGELHLGFVASAASDVLPHLLPRQRAQAPALALHLTERTTREQLDALARGHLDVGIGRDLEHRGDLTVTPLRREPLVAALPATHRLAHRRVLRLAELADDPFVLLPTLTAPRSRGLLTALCASAGFDPQVAQEALQYTTILGLVAGGIGVSLVPRAVARWGSEGVRCVGVADAGAHSTLALLHREGDQRPAVRGLAALAVEALAPGGQRAREATSPANETSADGLAAEIRT